MEHSRHHRSNKKGHLYEELLASEGDDVPLSGARDTGAVLANADTDAQYHTSQYLKSDRYISNNSVFERQDNMHTPSRTGMLGDELQEGDDGAVLFLPPMSRCQLVLLATGWLGLSAVLVAWGVVLIPSQARAAVGEERAGTGVAIVVAVSSVVTVAFTPLIGWLSDKATFRMGKRRPFMMIGVVVCVVMMLVLGATNPRKPPPLEPSAADCVQDQDSSTTTTAIPQTTAAPDDMADTRPWGGAVALLAIVYSLATLGYQLVATPYTGLLADLTPRQQRGFGSGVTGVLTVFGNIAGAAIGFLYQTNVTILGMYGLLSAVVVISIAVVVFTQKEETPTPTFLPKKLSRRTGLIAALSAYLRPLRDHDFRYLFITRFLMQAGVAMVLFFLQLYLHDIIPLPGSLVAESATGLVLLPLFLSAGLSSVIAGHLSDRFGGRRKLFVIISCFIMSLAAFILTTVRHLSLCFVVATLFGIGFGTFIAVDFALALDILPSKRDAAKDLAIWHQSLVLPQLLAAPVGGLIRDGIRNSVCSLHMSPNHCGTDAGCPTAYQVLFGLTAAAFMLSGFLIPCIKGSK